MGGGWFGERIGEAAKEARSLAKATKDSPATGSSRLTATQRAEDHELSGPTIDLAVAPVAPVGKIGLRLQELLTPGPLVSDRRKAGGEAVSPATLALAILDPARLPATVRGAVPPVSIPVERAIAIGNAAF
jgi:hypothetical protein